MTTRAHQWAPGRYRGHRTQESTVSTATSKGRRHGLSLDDLERDDRLLPTVDGARIRCAESEGPPGPTVVLTSPWPESVFAFAPIWRTLGRRFRLFAVDLPGFGASARRDDLLSPRAMGAFLIRLIDECELGRPHLVAPDVGSSAALFAAASSRGALSSVVVGSGAVAVPIELGIH